MTEIGDNRPDYAKTIAAQFPIDFGYLARAVEALESEAAGLPTTITDRDDHDRIVDKIAAIRTEIIRIEKTRVGEKDPYLRAERAVDGFFTPLLDRLEALSNPKKGSLNAIVTAYLRKLEEDRKREEQRRANEARAEAERLRRIEEDKARALAEAKRAETKEKRDAELREAARLTEEANNRATVLESAAAAPPPVSTKMRTDRGSLSSLKKEWTFDVEDYAAIDLNLIRPYLSPETIDKALKEFAKRNHDRIAVPGVRFFETDSSQIRRGA